MHIVQFVHPDFLNSQSMPRFAKMIAEGMRARGHQVDIWAARPLAYGVPAPTRLKKWLGYIDQFIFFPLWVRWRLRRLEANTLFVFGDQALGPWVPLVACRPHVIHVHDFMALRSALGEFSQNPTGWAGRQYQALIRRGFSRGRHFVSVSDNTRHQLQRFLPRQPDVSEVIYNGLNYPFRRMNAGESLAELLPAGLVPPSEGFLLHVGGNEWYKNRQGVLEIYQAYARQAENPLPLWLVGTEPTMALKALARQTAAKGKVRFISGLSNKQVCAAYSAARLMVFPSLAEGFGWPIAEAMACGCLVLTTGEAPMTEVGGDAAFYIPSRPQRNPGAWAEQSGARVLEILQTSPDETGSRRQRGYRQVAKFDAEQTLNAYERIYRQALGKAQS
ncbi:Glycosyltransferase [Polaromonas sp. CG9_12]|nr:Glycosyltransferase [Polaromonas sp. CG9_12]